MQQPERAAPSFYVQAQGRAWGPYPLARLAGFVEEGRVTAETPISASPDGPFAPAHRFGLPGLPGLSPSPLRPAGTRPVSPALPNAAVVEPESAPVVLGAPKALVVIAGLQMLSDEGMEAALAAYGPYQRVRPGLWVIRARLGAAALRNALSRRLRGGDTLLVVEASLEQAAWFNIDQAQERALRQLWAG